jgi:hypothetical protein
MKSIQIYPRSRLSRIRDWFSWQWYKFRKPLEAKYIGGCAKGMAEQRDKDIMDAINSSPNPTNTKE